MGRRYPNYNGDRLENPKEEALVHPDFNMGVSENEGYL